MNTQTLRMLRWRGVCAAHGCSRSNLYADINADLFPLLVQPGWRAVGWPYSDLVAEQQVCIGERDARAVKPASGDGDLTLRGEAS